MKNIILIFLLILPIHLMAAGKSIGVVAILDGGVWRAPGGDIDKKVSLKRNSKVYEQDTIITGDDGFVKILMEDDTVFDLGETTKFTFDKFKLKSKKDRKAKYNFSYGKMRSIFTIKAKSEKDLQIKTPDVVMGVRGTEILADVFESKGKLQTNIALVSGKLNIQMPDIKDIANNFDIKPGAVFNTEQFKENKDFAKSLKKISPAKMKKLSQVSMMKKGSFLFDTVNEGKAMPVSKAMKKIVTKVKDAQKGEDGKKGGKLKNLGKPRPGDIPQGDKGFSPQENREFRKNLKKKLINKIRKRRQRRRFRRKRQHTDAPIRPPGDNMTNIKPPEGGTYNGGTGGTVTQPPN